VEMLDLVMEEITLLHINLFMKQGTSHMIPVYNIKLVHPTAVKETVKEETLPVQL
jgi:hypothetical protein